MSRYVDKDALIKSIKNTADLGGWIGEALYQIKQVAIKYIDSAPSIDIVFCKECKWLRYCETEDLDLYLDCDKPDGGGIPRNEDWYCADGEREGE